MQTACKNQCARASLTLTQKRSFVMFSRSFLVFSATAPWLSLGTMAGHTRNFALGPGPHVLLSLGLWVFPPRGSAPIAFSSECVADNGFRTLTNACPFFPAEVHRLDAAGGTPSRPLPSPPAVARALRCYSCRDQSERVGRQIPDADGDGSGLEW